jgi:hypothetical protein
MGYSKDLVSHLRQNGLWDQLTGDQQKRFERLTDEQARQILVMDDQWEMSEQPAVEAFGLMSLVQMIRAFQGALVELGGEDVGKLSKAGKLLAEFFLELRQRGMSADDVDDDLRQLNPLVIAALIAAYKGPSE